MPDHVRDGQRPGRALLPRMRAGHPAVRDVHPDRARDRADRPAGPGPARAPRPGRAPMMITRRSHTQHPTQDLLRPPPGARPVAPSPHLFPSRPPVRAPCYHHRAAVLLTVPAQAQGTRRRVYGVSCGRQAGSGHHTRGGCRSRAGTALGSRRASHRPRAGPRDTYTPSVVCMSPSGGVCASPSRRFPGSWWDQNRGPPCSHPRSRLPPGPDLQCFCLPTTPPVDRAVLSLTPLRRDAHDTS